MAGASSASARFTTPLLGRFGAAVLRLMREEAAEAMLCAVCGRSLALRPARCPPADTTCFPRLEASARPLKPFWFLRVCAAVRESVANYWPQLGPALQTAVCRARKNGSVTTEGCEPADENQGLAYVACDHVGFGYSTKSLSTSHAIS
eukprot:10024-Rhodomonas_salina.1